LTNTVMIQGTGSNVGKSVITAALCRIFREDGINVAPFKSQNMALNSFVTKKGGEMGRAQVVQAEAAGLEPHVDMNPVLIKPHSDAGAQVIIHGKLYGNFSAKEFHAFKKKAMLFVEESFGKLSERHDLIIIEGAGSPAEINLRENDIANMGTAHMADAPVILVGDIDKGGVFASLVGTLELLDERDLKRVQGFIINKFRGDLSLLQPGLDFLEAKTGLPVLGVIPFFRKIYIPEEDSVNLESSKLTGLMTEDTITIAVLYLPHISNFTDLDPLASEELISLRYVKNGEKIGSADIVIIPGTKNTTGDLKYIRESGYAEEIKGHVSGGGHLIGICGGYQMLGNCISDPHNVEGGGYTKGLGYLDIKTVMKKDKKTRQVMASRLRGNTQDKDVEFLSGYEIHMGESSYIKEAKPLFSIRYEEMGEIKGYDGATSKNGKIWGTYIHGIFENDIFRTSFINDVRRKKGFDPLINSSNHFGKREEGYAKLAELVRSGLNMEKIYKIAGLE